MELGRFITFEGGEGAGKSTQARLLADALQTRGISSILTREPGGTPGAEAIRALLLHPPGEGWGPRAEALLFAAARADHVARLIRPALEGGKWVICDRFIDSSRAYQGVAGELGDDAIRALHHIGSNDLLPDIAIVMSAAPEGVAARLAARDGDRSDAIGGRDADYHSRVVAAFADFAVAEPGRFLKINGEGSPAAVHDRVMTALAPLLTAALA